MANIKITDLTAYTNPAATDVLPIVDVDQDVTKKISIQDLLQNVGIGADQVAISTNGIGRLFVNADGNVGVGTDTPSRDFDLLRTASDADLRVESTSAGNDARLELIGDSAGASQIRFGDENSTNSGLITYEHSSNSLNISTNGNAVATIDSGGLLYSVPTYDNTSTATTNYLRISASGEFFRSTSSIAYKTDVEDMEDKYADAILNLRPVWYRSTCKRDNPNHSHWGFIAEEVEQIDPRLCSFKNYETSIDEEGNRVVTPLDTPVVDGVDYASLTPLLLNLVKRQKAQIEALETRIAALEAN